MPLGVPKSVRRAARRWVPEHMLERLRNGALRRYLVQSVITQEGAVHRALRRMSGGRPTLFHLDVHVTDHCNLNCRGCEHYSSISDPAFADLGQVAGELDRMAELFENIEQIYLLGGEPLLHPRVVEFVAAARKAFPRTRLYVMTNGVLVTRVPESFWDAMRGNDAVLLCDSYPINIDHARIDALGVEHGVKVEWMKPAEEFFKIPLDVDAKSDPKASFNRCRGLSNCAIIRDGRLYPCAHAAYADIPAKRFDLPQIEATTGDSISIFGEVDGDRIIEFLSSPIPWCARCDFDSFETFSWSRGKGEPGEWLKQNGRTDS